MTRVIRPNGMTIRSNASVIRGGRLRRIKHGSSRMGMGQPSLAKTFSTNLSKLRDSLSSLQMNRPKPKYLKF